MTQAHTAITAHLPCVTTHTKATVSQVSTTGATVINSANSANMITSLIKFPNIVS